MKTTAKKIRAILVILGFLFLGNGKINAQVTIVNSLTCDIVISWESWNPFPGCSICGAAGNVTIIAGNSISVGCNREVCISIVEVGGNPITWYNHTSSLGQCHGATVPWQVGQTSTGQCTGGWSANWNGTFTVLTIQ
jgi:hypothetical protein